MGLDSCMKCIKYTLFIFNFFFWLVGVLILGFGLYLLIDPIAKTNVFLGNEDPLFPLRITLIVIGSVVMLIGFLGCCGSILENKCMLLTFFVLMTIVFLALVVAGLLLVFMRNQAKETISEGFANSMERLLNKTKESRSDPEATNATDAIHIMFKCCGIRKGIQDFKDRNLDAPPSCSSDNKEKGCVGKLGDFIDTHWMTTIIVVFSVASITLIGMILSILLFCALRDEYDY